MLLFSNKTYIFPFSLQFILLQRNKTNNKPVVIHFLGQSKCSKPNIFVFIPAQKTSSDIKLQIRYFYLVFFTLDVDLK